MMFKAFALASLAAPAALGHSWLDCVDFNPATGQCNGYPRDWNLRKAEPLGADVGRDIRPGADVPAGLVCDPQKEPYRNPPSQSYTNQYPMTRAAPGQTLTWRWPAKNHATVGVQRGVQVFFSKAPNTGDDFSHITSKAAWVQKYPQLDFTFSNCTPNQPNQDKIPCLGSFAVPTDLQPGIYTVMWWWEFNAGEFYNSCADIEITGAGGGTPQTPQPTPQPTNPGTPATPQPTQSNQNGGQCNLSGEVRLQSEWGTGFVGEIVVTANTQLSQWSLEVDLGTNGGQITNVWNCVAAGGNVIDHPEGYLSTLSPGQSVTCGFLATKPNGSPAFGGQGARVSVVGCDENLQLPQGNGGNQNGANSVNSPLCNERGILSAIDGVDQCFNVCSCVGSYGIKCESSVPVPYWDITMTSREEYTGIDFTDCGTQLFNADLVRMALSITTPGVTVDTQVVEATADKIVLRVFDNGAIETLDLGYTEFKMSMNAQRVTPEGAATDGGNDSGDTAIIILGAVGAGLVVAGAVVATRRKNQATQRLSNPMAPNGVNVMDPNYNSKKAQMQMHL